jgi:streptomycin 6-kinase
MTPWLGRRGSGDAPTSAIVFASRRISTGDLTPPSVPGLSSAPVDGQALTHAEWLDCVPSLLSECATAWGLTPGPGYAPGAAGYATRVSLPDGTPAVLKLIYPHRESEHEADALELWDGDGAVRLLARDDERHAMLLERCEPGTFLSNASPDPLRVLIELLPRLWKSGVGFRPLGEEAVHWLEGDVRDIPDARIRDAAAHYLRELAPTQAEQVLLHQDLHGENVLAAEREPWLVIDPKPLSGEREFAVAPIVRSSELGHSRRDVLYRLDRLTAELGLDRERARGWTIAQTAAWSTGRDYETIEWLLQ